MIKSTTRMPHRLWAVITTLAIALPLGLLFWPVQPPAIAQLTWRHLSTTGGDLEVPGGSLQQTAALVLDIDSDGADDFVIASRRPPGPAVVWYQRQANGWRRYLIEAEPLDIEAGGAFWDIDGDGDLDIALGGDRRSNRVWWWENPYPNFDQDAGWVRREIKNSGVGKHHDMFFGDFDDDGAPELVFWNQSASQLMLAEIPADPRTSGPWAFTPIFTWSGGQEMEGLAAADVDQDGKLDIVGGGRWFKHQQGTTFIEHLIDDGQRFTRAAAGQLIPGGRPEIVFVAGDVRGPLRWYAWNGSNWVGHMLVNNVDHGHTLELGDANQDGHLDIFVAEMRLDGGNADAKMWLFFGDGAGNFTPNEIATGYDNHESRLADLDGDGDLDILGKPYNHDTPGLDIWLNQSQAGCAPAPGQWQRHVVNSDRPWRALFISAADLDGDGRADILSGPAWYKNPGAAGGVWVRNQFAAPLHNVLTAYDFDGDGDVDVLGNAWQDSGANPALVWARNEGDGQFTVLTNIPNGDGDFLQGVAVGHFQPDGLLEVALSWHRRNRGVQMLTVPDNPSTQTWGWRVASPVSQNEALSAGDIDGDGDLDLLLGTQWLRNDFPAATPWAPITLFDTTDNPDRNRLADINQDGRLDAVVGYEAVSVAGKLAWYEQPANAEDLWLEHEIATLIGPMSLDVQDMDGDGDLDVVAGEHSTARPAAARLFLFENVDGRGLNWRQHLIHTGDEHHDGAQVFDIDGDTDFDILSIGWTHNRTLLYENLSGCPGRPTATSTATPTGTSAETPTETSTNTPVGTPTETPTPTPVDTPTQTSPIATPSETPLPPPTGTPTSTATPVADQCGAGPTNLLLNPSFEAGSANWSFFTDGAGAFTTAGPAFECTSAARIQINRAGANVQLFQRGFVLEPATRYRLTFAAYSNSGHDLSLFVHAHNGSTNYGLSNWRANLTTAWQIFSVEFTTTGFSAPTTNTRLRFWLAPFDAAGDLFWIDAVRLEKVTSGASPGV